MTPFTLPSGYPRIKKVSSFEELVSTPLKDGVNALCWQRELPFDFCEIVSQLGVSEGITPLDEARLLALPVSAAGKAAIKQLLEDQQLLLDHGLSPSLDCICSYPRDEEQELVPTDVYSFHADSATVEADTYLCTYNGATSEGLRNEDALRCVDLRETRAKLLGLFGGEDGECFQKFLAEHCYDLHYVPAPHAQPFSFGRGNLWRIAIAWPGCPVLPCVHRAPAQLPGDPPRLLLIS
jgi:hypothetical protein